MSPVAAGSAPWKPPAALRSRALRALDRAGNFFCEPLPGGIDEPHGPVPDDELIPFAIGRDHHFESGAGPLFREFPRQQVAPLLQHICLGVLEQAAQFGMVVAGDGVPHGHACPERANFLVPDVERLRRESIRCF